MNVAKHDVTSRSYLRAIFIPIVMGFGLIALTSGQTTDDFTIVSPEHVVNLVQVEQTSSNASQPNALQFTFTNSSNKTILELCISALRGSKFEEMVCMHSFAGGGTLPGPGATMMFTFDANDFVSEEQPGEPQQRSLRVYAVVFADGSYIGAKNELDKIEDLMIGAALETKRISDILAKSSDDSITGLDSVLPQIGTSPPSTADPDAADRLIGKLQGQPLPGIDQSYIDNHVNRHTTDFLDGVGLARDRALYAIRDLQATAALSPSGGAVMSNAVSEARLHGRADLAREYQLLSASQITHVAAFKGERDAQRNTQ